MRNLVAFLVGLLIGGLLAASLAHAETTVIENKGQPVPSAMAPSMSAFSQDVCAIGVSGAVNGGVFSIAGGTMATDQNCVQLRWAKFLSDSGLKVAAVSVACSSHKFIWQAMEMSGSPCPIGGSVGDAARQAWYKLHPEWFEDLYGKEFVLVTPLRTSAEDK